MGMEKARFFKVCLEMMRSKDALEQEAGFQLMQRRVSEFAPELLAEAATETRDWGLRSWLYELLRETRSPLPLDHYRALLVSSDENERRWAIQGLKAIDTPEARKCLFDARGGRAKR